MKWPGRCMRQLPHQLPHHRQLTNLQHPRKLSHNSRTLSGLLPSNVKNFSQHTGCSTVNMGVKLDLKKIALHARNAEYNPKRFAAVIMRIRWADHNLPPRDYQSLFFYWKKTRKINDVGNQGATDNGPDIQLWKDGLHWSQVWGGQSVNKLSFKLSSLFDRPSVC